MSKEVKIIVMFLVLITAVGFGIRFSSALPAIRTCCILLLSLLVTFLSFYLITVLFGRTDYRKGIFNFFIGDEGTYSLSRLQAVAWALIIISYQISVLLALFNNLNGNYFAYYQPVFSESANWLLGLSLSSYIATKGITVNNIRRAPYRYKYKSRQLSWKDLLSGDNGLDFSRCQMLIWTILALFVFESKCYYFVRHVQADPISQVAPLFTNMYNEYAPQTASITSPAMPFVPYLPWAFVVLMGLSNGVYVGKKLVPTFKLDEIKDAKQEQMTADTRQLEIKKQLLQQMLATSSAKTDLDKKNFAALTASINDLQTNIAESRQDIADIQRLK